MTYLRLVQGQDEGAKEREGGIGGKAGTEEGGMNCSG